MIKKISLFTAALGLTLSPLTHANLNWYFGLQAGASDTSYSAKSENLVTFNGTSLGSASPSTDEDHWGGRLYTGYKISQYLAGEIGFTKFGDVDIKNIYGVSGAKTTLKPQAGDIVAKIMMPFQDTWSIFTKLGVAYAYLGRDPNSTARSITTPTGQIATVNRSNDTAWRATYGIGAGYDLTHCLSLEAFWQRVQGGNGLKDAELAGLGLNWFADCA